jgi:hypothetical protein
MIEGAIREDPTIEEDTDVAILRVLGPFPAILDWNFGQGIVEQKPREARSVPVALHVCYEL